MFFDHSYTVGQSKPKVSLLCSALGRDGQLFQFVLQAEMGCSTGYLRGFDS